MKAGGNSLAVSARDFIEDRLWLMLRYLELFGRGFALAGLKNQGDYTAALKELNEKWTIFRNIEYPGVKDEILKYGSRPLT